MFSPAHCLLRVLPIALFGLCVSAMSCRLESQRLPGRDIRGIVDLRQQLEACRRAHEASRADFESLRSQQQRYAVSAGEETRRRSGMQRAMDQSVLGVCLIHGIFTLQERRDEILVPVADEDGAPLRLEYLGSGFLVTPSGHVLTNRHIAEPWWGNDAVTPLLARGLEPTFLELTATFPGTDPISVDLRTIRISPDQVDLAVFQVDVEDVPVLPLSDQDPAQLRGERLMLIGYPTGLSALLARAEPDIAAAALNDAHDATTLIAALSRHHAIAPLVTHGTLNDVTSSKLIYDAVTTSGGSGGPVLGPDGEVIGVNFAMLRGFQGSNFGVPIRFAESLIP